MFETSMLTDSKNVLERLPGETEQLIYVSTTGVYSGHDSEWVTETTTVQPGRPSSHACLLAETTLKQSRWWDKSVILRLAGNLWSSADSQTERDSEPLLVGTECRGIHQPDPRR